LRIWRLGSGVWGSGFGILRLGFGLNGSGFRIKSEGCRVEIFWFGVKGSRFRYCISSEENNEFFAFRI
jgi:hypothetical protein